jgi:outer membrane biosynthesis protein TonB
MEPRQIIRTDVAASAIAHLALVGLVILISEVHPFRSQPPETVAVDIVTPEQLMQAEAKVQEKGEEKGEDQAKQKPPEPTPELKLPKLDVADKADTAAKPAPKPQQSSPEPEQKQPAQARKQREASVPPQPSAPQPPPQAMPQAAPPPAYQPPAPDITVRYGVMLGLPPELPVAPKDAKDDGGDGKDSVSAKLPPEVVAELRRHLRSCARLPAEVAPTDSVRVRLRAVFASDGTLARPPILIEAPPSAKGVAIVKSATSALLACQPYKMLPADKFGEWQVLDLPFTPQDFGG